MELQALELWNETMEHETLGGWPRLRLSGVVFPYVNEAANITETFRSQGYLSDGTIFTFFFLSSAFENENTITAESFSSS